MVTKHAVMALSGGMDSTSLLLHLIKEGYDVTCLSFDYGQKHSIELERASSFIEYLSQSGYVIKHNLVDFALGLFHSDLLDSGGVVPEGHYEQESMKATVVPNRNAIFSSLLYGTALSLSEQTGGKSLVALGVHSGDHAIYPDCRPEFYSALEHAFAIGNWGSEKVEFYLPYIKSDKLGILRDAESTIEKLNLDFNEVFSRTITSYSPDSEGRRNGKTGSDVERILEVDSKITKSFISEAIWKKMELYLLTKRNKVFVDRIMELMEGNQIFIAVGASHLGGKTGLLNQFEDFGFKLKPIQALD